MSRHDDNVSLRHMLDYAREAVEMMDGRSRPELESHRMLNLAVVRLIEIIGEAANRVSDAGRAKYPEIPWGDIIGMRNRVIYGYDRIDFEVLWKTLQHDVPALVEQLERVVK